MTMDQVEKLKAELAAEIPPDEHATDAVKLTFACQRILSLHRIIGHLEDQLSRRARDATEEAARLKRWVADLQSGMFVNCVYCGHRYGPGETTPVSMADALKAHVEQCPEHPMSKLRERLDTSTFALREAEAALDNANQSTPCPMYNEALAATRAALA